MKKKGKGFLLPALLFIFCCAPKEKMEVIPLSSDLEGRIASADSSYLKGSYIFLKRAFQIYQEVYRQPVSKKRIAEKLARTSLLIVVREKELGIVNRSYMDEALKVIQENPTLSGLLPYAEIAELFWVQGKGVMRDIDEKFSSRWTSVRLQKMEAELKAKASTDEFFAYLYATMKCAFLSPFEKGKDFRWLAEIFPDSLLLKYKTAICPDENEIRLRELLAQDPEFWEAAYFLGNIALTQRNLIEAEKYLVQAHQGIPESPQVTILLGSIYLAFEELDRSLEFYEKTLAIAPDYRDALLGKAICLSYLGKPHEAIAVLERVIALGHWLIGEGYYWLAWNHHELKNNKVAATSIEEAKSRLPTSSEVFTLSGVIALEEDELVKAEKDLKEALQYNPNGSEALFSLGSLYARREEWLNSGLHFEKAAQAFGMEEQELEQKIAQAENSSLSAERKVKFVRKKRFQLEKAAISKATSFYNAAAGYLNGGEREKAFAMAMQAAHHPLFKEKAEELVLRLRKFP